MGQQILEYNNHHTVLMGQYFFYLFHFYHFGEKDFDRKSLLCIFKQIKKQIWVQE